MFFMIFMEDDFYDFMAIFPQTLVGIASFGQVCSKFRDVLSPVAHFTPILGCFAM